MSRIQSVNPDTAALPARQLLGSVEKQLGTVPNLFKTLAHSPAALRAYLGQTEALAGGVLDRKLRERIAIATAGANGCDYCASAHTLLGKRAGLAGAELERNLRGGSGDARAQAALDFAVAIVERRGRIDDASLDRVRDAGFSEAEIVEIIAHVGMNLFTNYFNHIAETEIDFPLVGTADAA